ncbi:unnamed protein product [Ceutorhynchus assimilis]|uniref:RRM domain-containing protein n=1 Tax=Ceutorhynchus assimilis TaxID=467358 RepID=A0A9N9QMY1_9CUCU|nr:unnamed protein product [Ceutorhynchus assimilis]
MASQLDCEARTIVLVEFIPDELDRQRVQELFSEIVPVESTILMRSRTSAKYGLVFFYQPQDALTAVEHFEGYEILGRTLRVSLAQYDKEAIEKSQNVDENRTNIIVNYLPQSVTRNEMYSLFSTCGESPQCKLMVNICTGTSRCYGFVKYHLPEEAAKAINLFDGLKIQNKILRVSYARPCSEQTRGTNLYVNNLPEDVTEEDVRVLFRPYGQIINCRIIGEKSTRHQVVPDTAENSPPISKRVAFVIYNQRSQAKTAISMLNGVFYQGNFLGVKFAKLDYLRTGYQNLTYSFGYIFSIIQNYAWYMVFGGLAFYYIYTKFLRTILESTFLSYENYKKQKEEQEYAAKYHKNPDLFSARVSAQQNRAQKLQEQYDQEAREHQAKLKENIILSWNLELPPIIGHLKGASAEEEDVANKYVFLLNS